MSEGTDGRDKDEGNLTEEVTRALTAPDHSFAPWGLGNPAIPSGDWHSSQGYGQTPRENQVPFTAREGAKAPAR